MQTIIPNKYWISIINLANLIIDNMLTNYHDNLSLFHRYWNNYSLCSPGLINIKI
jgi:hypothetical protein